jgi:hypothetical protein
LRISAKENSCRSDDLTAPSDTRDFTITAPRENTS